MRVVMRLAGLLLGIGLCTGLALAQAANPPPLCRIGKISYCAKYGGILCVIHNYAKDPLVACESWLNACVECHNDIPACLGGTRPPASAKLCNTCNQRWLSCMRRIDAAHDKNRNDNSRHTPFSPASLRDKRRM